MVMAVLYYIELWPGEDRQAVRDVRDGPGLYTVTSRSSIRANVASIDQTGAMTATPVS